MGFYSRYVFPVILDLTTRPVRPDCEALLSDVHGQVLELGVGSGANLPLYGDSVESVTGIEPDAVLLGKANERLKKSPTAFPASLIAGDAQQLTFDDASFDAVVACLVFCTIPDPLIAAREAFRVLKPGGKLVFFEHVGAKDTVKARWQARINPLWRKMACGCDITRDTRQVFESAGFEFESFNAFDHPKIMWLVSPVIQGVAVKPRDA